MTPPSRRRLVPLLLATACTLMLLDALGFAPIRSARVAALSSARPIVAVLDLGLAPVTETWDGAVHSDRLAEENRRLRRRVAELEGRLEAVPDVEAELSALRLAVDVEPPAGVETVTARVVADRRDPLERLVEIDKGSAHGIARSMPAMTGAGLIGRVEVVAPDRAVIRLVTDREMSVGIRTEFGLGLAVGDGRGGMTLHPTPELARAIATGADDLRLLTSGVDRSVFPPGLPVGRVAAEDGPAVGVEGWTAVDEQDPAGPRLSGRTVGPSSAGAAGSTSGQPVYRVEPLGDVDDPVYVTVLLTEVPA